jgi:hypothetical protein
MTKALIFKPSLATPIHSPLPGYILPGALNSTGIASCVDGSFKEVGLN